MLRRAFTDLEKRANAWQCPGQTKVTMSYGKDPAGCLSRRPAGLFGRLARRPIVHRIVYEIIVDGSCLIEHVPIQCSSRYVKKTLNFGLTQHLFKKALCNLKDNKHEL